MRYDFEWDREKARRNHRKHRVTFEQSATVFRDPKAASLYDEEHSEMEERWITLGISSNSGLLVVHHTFEEIDGGHVRVRIFSCRKATQDEIRQYGEQ
uniref:Uncharacterized protein n=1 Tax=Candidatus Kentrum sp. FW TaxID=2126338 RepID=A0A450T4U6_9GAMM|nr:MAG: hypothetical protein BECKFW1821B_GA0114236_106710 [Candidatus Kentron sp. FW]